MKSNKEITPEQALTRLQDLCSRGEHSSGEIIQKLRLWKVTAEHSERIVKALIEDRYVDDRRFAHAYVNDKIKMARWGRRKVQQNLYLKGIPHDIMQEALSEIDEDVYIENLTYIIRYKIKSAPKLAESYEGRTKLYRMLLTKGYEADIAARVLRGVLQDIGSAD